MVEAPPLTQREEWSLYLQLLSIFALLLLGLEVSHHPAFFWGAWLAWAGGLAAGGVLDWGGGLRERGEAWSARHTLDLFALLLTPPLMILHVAWVLLFLLRQLWLLLRLCSRWPPTRALTRHLMNHPAQLVVVSFLGLIAVGTLLLRMPVATHTHEPISWLEALFTSTSASCVTGLVVLDTPKIFSRFGQTVLLALIQIGGLGIMTLSVFIIWLLGERLGLSRQHTLGELLDEPTPAKVLLLLRTILLATLLIESVGALLLLSRWHGSVPGGFSAALYHAVFHSVSAFCNAGFALWSNSMVPHQTDVVVNFTLIGLIFGGGLGFPVFASLFIQHQRNHLRQLPTGRQRSFWTRLRIYLRMLPLNTKIILWAHPLFFLLAFLLYLPLEWEHTLAHLATGHKLMAGLFQSVTLRTAGFNSVDFSLLTPATLLMMIFFMFIGGCSGGTAGGVKVNTIMVLFYSLRATVRGRRQTEVFGRAVPQETITRAYLILFIFTGLFFASLFALLLTHPNVPFSHLMFEVTSALGTVGVTTTTPDGASTTSKLTTGGRLLITCLMFAGRIGPLTLALAIANQEQRGQFQYPRERIYVG